MTKQEVINMLQNLPEDIDFDKEIFTDLIYTAYVTSGIKAGLADVEAGRTYTHEQVMAMFCQKI